MRGSALPAAVLVVLALGSCGRIQDEYEVEIDGERLCTEVCERSVACLPEAPDFYMQCPGFDADATVADCRASCMEAEPPRDWAGPCARLREIRTGRRH